MFCFVSKFSLSGFAVCPRIFRLSAAVVAVIHCCITHSFRGDDAASIDSVLVARAALLPAKAVSPASSARAWLRALAFLLFHGGLLKERLNLGDWIQFVCCAQIDEFWNLFLLRKVRCSSTVVPCVLHPTAVNRVAGPRSQGGKSVMLVKPPKTNAFRPFRVQVLVESIDTTVFRSSYPYLIAFDTKHEGSTLPCTQAIWVGNPTRLLCSIKLFDHGQVGVMSCCFFLVVPETSN